MDSGKRSISSGFVRDADKLVQTFVNEKTTDFAVFAEIWKKHRFAMIFLGRPNEKELLEFTRQIFRITLELLCKFADETKIGYLFLLYGLFRYQPLKPPVKVRITLDQWPHITSLRDDAEVREDKYVLFVVRYLVRNGFDYVACPTLMGPCLSSDAVCVDLSLEAPKKLIDIKKQVCKVQEDVDTCIQELKIVKLDYENSATSIDCAPSASKHNIPFGGFLSTLDPYPPPNDSTGNIGNRRALLKAAAYNKAISKVTKLADQEAKGKINKVGRPRKVPGEEEPSILQQPIELPDPDDAPVVRTGRGKKREKLFKKKYHFLEVPEGTTSNVPERTTSIEPEGNQPEGTEPEGTTSIEPEGNQPEGTKSYEDTGARPKKSKKSKKPN